jgi:hypothetical protein
VANLVEEKSVVKSKQVSKEECLCVVDSLTCDGEIDVEVSEILINAVRLYFNLLEK